MFGFVFHYFYLGGFGVENGEERGMRGCSEVFERRWVLKVGGGVCCGVVSGEIRKSSEGLERAGAGKERER